jgi:hypothetical protein
MKKLIKKPILLFLLFIVFTILHNAFYAIFKFEEPVFFFLALLSALLFLISVIYNIIIFIRKKIK